MARLPKNMMTTRPLKHAPKPDSLASRPLDLSKAVRGKYFDRVQEGTNVVLIAPDLMESFPDSEAVNAALRGLKEIADRSRKAS